MQLFPKEVRLLWNEWAIRLMVSFSLSIQVVLAIFGSRRKYIGRGWIRILVWSTYLTADWVATAILGNLASNCQDDSENTSQKQKNQLHKFWVPFLLLHLGGSDNITAYALEDNELWLRHLLGLVSQVGIALYVFLLSWSNNIFTFMAIPMFVMGIIKCGEKTFLLRSSSTEHFESNLLSTSDPSPELVKLIMKGDIKKELNHHQESNPLVVAYHLFKRCAYLFSGLLLHCLEENTNIDMFRSMPADKAFYVVATELGFMYDMLFTKAKIVYSRLGILLRCISFSFWISTLIVFSNRIDINAYPIVDIFITYILLIGAIAQEVYTFIKVFYSDWTKLCLTKLKRANSNTTGAATSATDLLSSDQKRWSQTMGQFNLLNFCLKDMSAATSYSNGINKLLFRISNVLGKHQYLTPEDVNVDLQENIFAELLDKVKRISLEGDQESGSESMKRLLAERGDYVAQTRYRLSEYDWHTVEDEFDESLLIWHVATDLCYRQDLDRYGEAVIFHSKCKMATFLSNYMLYLLVLIPSMMPKGIGGLRFKNTCCEAMRLLELKNEKVSNTKAEAYELLFDYEIVAAGSKCIKAESMSVLESGCKVARALQSLRSRNDGLDYTKKWEMISEIWIEMLAFAASNCGWKEHAQQLRKGGDLLTHVCLLMAHLGLSQQLDIKGRIVK